MNHYLKLQELVDILKGHKRPQEASVHNQNTGNHNDGSMPSSYVTNTPNDQTKLYIPTNPKK